MEELNIFELHLSPVQKLFVKNNFKEPEFNKKYTFFTNKQEVVGELVAYDDHCVVVANTWTTLKDNPDGYYADYHKILVADILKINTQQNFDFPVGKPYRAELYIRNEQTDRPTTWISCYYRGTTHSGKIVVSIIGKKAEIMVLKKSDIKGFFQLSLDDAQSIEQNEEGTSV